MNFTITRRDTGATELVSQEQLIEACERLSDGQRHALEILPEASPKNSTFAEQVTDESAKQRIEAQHAALARAGITVDTKEQLFSTGTRLADVGYETQRAHHAEHERKRPIGDVAHELRGLVESEKREDLQVSARELADAIHVNGAITAFGFELTEQAIRGLAGRLESPMLGYVLGVRERMASATLDAPAERAIIAEVLAHECKRAPEVALKLRARRGVGDIFACLSPSYVPADAPEVVSDLISDMPSSARGSFAYDAASTSWELRAAIWTPTPVEQQAVGEPFEGYASFQSRDNGTSRFRGGGGVTLLRCLNASTYTAGVDVSRVHRSGVMADITRMTRGALAAIHALCAAWGTNRAAVIEEPTGVRIEDAIPGFWRYCLRDRSSELAGVLPGRSETHVQALSQAYFSERRDPSKLVRSDLAQGWTRYIQDQPAPVRREAETAIGEWLVNGKAPQCDLRA